jgi:NADH:ubiquinone reductase (H+-translocating)
VQSQRKPQIVIIGAGFGGLAAAHEFRRAPVRVTIIDHSNHHLFQPLLYQVATAALSPADIATPIRRVFRNQTNVEVLLAEATAIDVQGKRVVMADGEVSYDYLVIATGATHAYFGHDDWAEYAPGLKSLKDALRIRQHILMAFEVAEREQDELRRRAWMTFVIVGGGPTGVELAGTLAEVSRQTLAKDFRHIDTASTRVILVEGAARILGAYPEDLSARAREQLERLGVTVWTGVQVTGIDA